jgi:iron-siderophore transport system substrate-binding protein
VGARILIALALVGALAGCQESGFDESKETQRPLKVQHAMDPLTGTKVPGQAERPLTLTRDTLGDTAALHLRPVAAVLQGGRVPDYLRAATRGVKILDSVDLGAIEAAGPDVILGAKELDGDRYDELKKIAPTIMSEGSDWKLNVRLHGEALGRTNDAEELLIDWDKRVAGVKRAIGDRKLSIEVTLGPGTGDFDLGAESFAGSILADVGIKPGRGGEEVLHVTAGQEWVGGGVLAARAVLADIRAAL